MLEMDLVDGAVIVVQNSDFTNVGDLFISKIARTKDEVLEAQGSKYIQVSMENALEEIRQDPSLKRIAYVGTGCQIRAHKRNVRVIPGMQDRVFYYLGLFCKQNKIPEFTNYLLDIVRHNHQKISELRYRGNGCPDWLSINKENRLSFKDWKYGCLPWYVNAYSCDACLTCGDCTAEEADISCGDAWLPQYEERADNLGYSVLLTRSVFGEHLVQKMAGKKIIEIEKIDPVLIAKAQWLERIIIKKLSSYTYGWLFNKKARIIRLGESCLGQKPSFFEMLNTLSYFFWSCFFSGRIFRKLIVYYEPIAKISFRLGFKITQVLHKAYLGPYKVIK